MTTRFLLFCISSFHFHKDVTLDGLHEVIAKDAEALYKHGLQVTGLNLRIVLPH